MEEPENVPLDEVVGEIDPEWQKYWDELIDGTIILTGLLILRISLLKAKYEPPIKKKLRERLDKLIRKYDEPWRKKGDSKS